MFGLKLKEKLKERKIRKKVEKALKEAREKRELKGRVAKLKRELGSAEISEEELETYARAMIKRERRQQRIYKLKSTVKQLAKQIQRMERQIERNAKVKRERRKDNLTVNSGISLGGSKTGLSGISLSVSSPFGVRSVRKRRRG